MYLTVDMIHLECGKCGLLFSMTETFYKKRKKDHESFYCPAGHSRYWPQKSNEEILREQLKRSELECKQAEKSLKEERGYSKELKRSRSALKGTLTKTKKRISAGVCICCNRTFQNVARHMKSQHPDFAERK